MTAPEELGRARNGVGWGGKGKEKDDIKNTTVGSFPEILDRMVKHQEHWFASDAARTFSIYWGVPWV